MDLNAAIEAHRKWLNGEEGGEKLVLRYSNMRGCDMSYSDMRGCGMRGCDMRGCGMRYSDMRGCDMSFSDMRGCDLSYSDMRGCDLSYSDMRGCDLSYSNLSGCDLSGAVGVLTQWQWVSDNLTKTDNGYICYKTFNEHYSMNVGWKIAEGETITENVNFDRCNPCACGINVGTLEYVLKNTKKAEVWECLIPFDALAGVCIPYNTDGRFRCEMVKLIRKHSRKDLMIK